MASWLSKSDDLIASIRVLRSLVMLVANLMIGNGHYANWRTSPRQIDMMLGRDKLQSLARQLW